MYMGLNYIIDVTVFSFHLNTQKYISFHLVRLTNIVSLLKNTLYYKSRQNTTMQPTERSIISHVGNVQPIKSIRIHWPNQWYKIRSML